MHDWPAGHTIGIYLSGGVDYQLVATARAVSDVPSLFRALAKKWEDSASAAHLSDDALPDSAHFY